MPFFEGATNVNASHSVFNDIKGDQVNYYGRSNSMNVGPHHPAAGFHSSFFNRSSTMGANMGNMGNVGANYNPNNNPATGHHVSYMGHHPMAPSPAPPPAAPKHVTAPNPSFPVNQFNPVSPPLATPPATPKTDDKSPTSEESDAMDLSEAQ